MEVMQANTLDDIFFLPLSQQALNELEHIQGIIQNVSYDENGRDTWLPSWGPHLHFQQVLFTHLQLVGNTSCL